MSLAGTLIAAMFVGQALQPLTGLWSDRVGGRVFTVLGLAGTSTAGALVALMPSPATLVLVLILLGSSNSVFHPQTIAAVRRASGNRPGTGLSVFLVGGEVGPGVWPLAASLLVTVGGIANVWMLAVPGLVTLPFLWRTVPAVPARRPDAAKVRWAEHMRPLSVLVIFASLRGVLLYGVSTFVPILWHQHGGSLAGGAGFVTVLMLVGLVGNIAGGRLGDGGGRRAAIGAGMTIAITAMIGFMLPGGIWNWILIAVTGIGLFATFPLTILIAQDIVPENRSFGTGMALGLSNALGALGVMALGPVASTWGTPAALWSCIVCGLGSLLTVFFLPRR